VGCSRISSLSATAEVKNWGAIGFDERLRSARVYSSPGPASPTPDSLTVFSGKKASGIEVMERNCNNRILGQWTLHNKSTGQLLLAMPDPWDEAGVRRAHQLLGAAPVAVAASQALLAQWLGSPPERAASTSPGAEPQLLAATGPVVEFVDSALRAAYAQGASDVHFECSRSGVAVRLRCDGVMASFARLDDARRAEEVISRIKVLAQLDITEKRLPQDGRFRVKLGEGDIDLRVSIIPSVFGEDAVLRLLDKAQMRGPQEQVSLDRLGFDENSAQQIRELAELPHGMLLVTGPTGSGKTTTVYAALSEVNNGLEKIITIEDPVEYELAGVLQVPVNERKGLTFAKGLRSVLRHDPDRILVGEIRDAETAEIAVQSALTGHQVFTTVHANSVFDVTGRFKHFGLDMFGFMAALNGVIVQRLVRCLCQDCVAQREATPREQRWLADMGVGMVTMVPRAMGCEACAGSGYKGRRVIAEVHSIDDGFRDLVTTQSPVSALRDYVYSKGIRSLGQQGADLVMKRLSSSEEIKRVVGWQ
jgi:general secretion pathway protein E